MNTKLNNKLDEFLYDENEQMFDKKVKEQKKFIGNDNSLIERFDRIFIDESGRQLLREQY